MVSITRHDLTGIANSSRGEGGKVIAWGLLLNITEP
jgi:hypothetical protein